MVGGMSDALREIQTFGINLVRASQTMLSSKCKKNLDGEKNTFFFMHTIFGARSNQFEIVQFRLKFCIKFIPRMLRYLEKVKQ